MKIFKILLMSVMILTYISQLSCIPFAEAKAEDTIPGICMSISKGVLWKDSISIAPNTKVDLLEYLEQLKGHLLTKWTNNKNIDSSVQVIFKIYKDGKVSDIQIKRSSGIKTVDDIAFQAVLECDPPSLPNGCPEYLSFMFVFDKNSSMLTVDYLPTIIGFGKNSLELVNEYFDNMYHKIKRNWYPPKDGGAHPSIMFKVNRDGSISEVKVLNEGSGCHIKFGN